MSEEAPPIRAAGILPPGDYLEALSMRLPKGVPFEYIMRRVSKSPEMHRRYAVCDIRDQCRLSRLIEDVPDLTVAQRLILTAAPATSNSGQLDIVFKALARAISENREVTVVDIPEIKVETLEKPLSGDRVYLESLEDLHKSLILFLWLSYRFISVFKDRDMAIYTKELTEEKINTCLLEFSANPALRKRVLTQRKLALPPGFTEMDLERSSLPGISLPELALPVDWTRGQSDVPDHELSVEDSATESVEARV
jgi:ATP-dependent RNA helicase SUPV3L1/SUV3